MKVEIKTKTSTEKILIVMHVVTWVLFIGLCIKTGATIISFFVSLFVTPMGAENLYLGLNLSGLPEFGKLHYIAMALFVICISVLKAFMVYLLIKIFLKINFSFPFSNEVALLIARISYVAFAIGAINLMAISYGEWLIKQGSELTYWNQSLSGGGEFLFFGGIIFIVAQVFKRGIEIQSENELTV